MYHSITIGNRNTWDDWHLVSNSRPLISPPSVKTHYVDIPGGDGSIDLTEALSGKPAYGNRSGSWDFIVVNSGQLVPNTSYGEWYARYTAIMEYLHGKEYRAVLEDDEAYYYTGRFTVRNWSSEKGNSILTINYDLDPYKRTIHDVHDRWLWDPFNFETDIIRSYKELVVRGSLVIDYIADMVTFEPVITCRLSGGNTMTVTFNDESYTLSNGENRMVDMHLSAGANRLHFMGYGTVTIESTGGTL